MSDAVTIRPRTVRYISIDSGRPYAGFQAACETAVPTFDRLEAVGVVTARIKRSQVVPGLINEYRRAA